MGNELLGSSLTELERRLPARTFFRANRSEIVRIGAVTSLERLSRGRYRLHLPKGESVVASETRSVEWRRRFK